MFRKRTPGESRARRFPSAVPTRSAHRLADLRFRMPVRYRTVWVALLILVVLAWSTAPASLGVTSLRLTTALAGVLLIATVGQTLVVSTGGLDITVASVMTLSGAICVRLSLGHNSGLLHASVVALLLGAVIGLVDGLLIVVMRLNALVVTLAMSSVVAGGLLLWTGVTFSVSGEVPGALHAFASWAWGPVSSLALTASGLALCTYLVIYKTRVGRAFLMVGVNPTAARVLGTRVIAHRITAFTIGGLLYALAGLFLAGYLSTPDNTLGSPYLLLTFVVVALAGTPLSGGPPSFLCTAASSLFIVLLGQYLEVKGLSGGVATTIQGVVLVIAVGALRIATAAQQTWANIARRRITQSRRQLAS